MTRLTAELKELIESRVGRFTVDVLTGWEAGLQGKQRIGRRLFPRLPPDHFIGPRRDDWYAGHKAGLAHRETCANNRSAVFVGESVKGQVIITRKGWGTPRGKVVTQMERAGCFGSVSVFYWEGSKIVRTVNCGI